MEDRLAGAGKRVTYVEFDDLAHSLDDSAARLRLLTETARFLENALGS
jgi:dipeptidyl aminopeptidase/acylaminoacyl peptidase